MVCSSETQIVLGELMEIMLGELEDSISICAGGHCNTLLGRWYLIDSLHTRHIHMCPSLPSRRICVSVENHALLRAVILNWEQFALHSTPGDIWQLVEPF